MASAKALLLLVVCFASVWAEDDAQYKLPPPCPLQNGLRFNMEQRYDTRWVCCASNKEYAEPAGTFMDHLERRDVDGQVTFYDSRCGLPLFRSAVGRGASEWWAEAVDHGWPSFRDAETFSENLVLGPADAQGVQEVASKCGTHLGHNLPDVDGRRFCINLLCVAGTRGGGPRLEAHLVDDSPVASLSVWLFAGPVAVFAGYMMWRSRGRR